MVDIAFSVGYDSIQNHSTSLVCDGYGSFRQLTIHNDSA